MKPSLWPSRIRLPRPRTPLPAYMTLPSAAAWTGSPSAPSMSMPLVFALNPWMILPPDGQLHWIRAASLARGALAGTDGVTGVTGAGVDAGGAGGVSVPGAWVGAGVGDGPVATFALPPSLSTCPILNWLGSEMLLSLTSVLTSTPVLCEIL